MMDNSDVWPMVGRWSGSALPDSRLRSAQSGSATAAPLTTPVAQTQTLNEPVNLSNRRQLLSDSLIAAAVTWYLIERYVKGTSCTHPSVHCSLNVRCAVLAAPTH